ncbi:MAG: hypothetical protein JO165_02325 [Candidatus Eremiobacteraeota bacterium]|nr:hypothetical protein [Candidatus Eremiobacteraeota bacterium]
MMSDFEQIPLSEQLLGVMRRAAQISLDNNEAFITPRSLLLSLLDDPDVGPAIVHVVVKEKLLTVPPAETDMSGLVRVAEDRLTGEQPALVRYDTLAFKTPSGKTSVWLGKDSLSIFLEGAQRVEGRFYPKHLALGFAAEAVRAPGVLAAIRVEPGALRDAVYRL